METPDETEVLAHLKASIWSTVSNIIEQETNILSTTATPTYTAALVQLVFDQLVSVGEDLEAFANHGGRKTIIPDDLLMVVRKNQHLKDLLLDELKVLKGEKVETKKEEKALQKEEDSDEDDEFDDDLEF